MTTLRRSVTLTRLAKQDEGIGLILVIGISAMMAILLAIITATAIRSLHSSSEHVNFEQSLAAAESGVDVELSKIQSARNQVPSVSYESPVSCRPATPAASVFATEATEKAWARAALEALPATCTQTNAQGEYVAFKVPGRQAVYSMGWSPTRTAANAESRLLKVEYIFAPYRPGKALLTGGNIDFSGSTTVNAIAGLPADVHTNANVTGINDSLNVSGGITAVGTVNACGGGVAGGCLTSQAPERVPVANPRAVYTDYALTTGQWYDLCDTGVVKLPSASGPCTGTQVSASPYRSWYWTAGNATTPGTWTLQNTGTSYPGVYYVYGANAELGANGNSHVDPNGVGARRVDDAIGLHECRYLQQVRRQHQLEALRHPELPARSALHRPGQSVRKRQLLCTVGADDGWRQDRPADLERIGPGCAHRQQHLRGSRVEHASKV